MLFVFKTGIAEKVDQVLFKTKFAGEIAPDRDTSPRQYRNECTFLIRKSRQQELGGAGYACGVDEWLRCGELEDAFRCGEDGKKREHGADAEYFGE